MGRRAKQRSMWPVTAACASAGAAVVAALLVPLDGTARTWVVRGLLIALVVGMGVQVVGRGRVTPTRANRCERITCQAVFFWALFTALTFAVPVFGGVDPLRAVISGAVAGVLFGAGLAALDPWVVQRGESRSSPRRPLSEGAGPGSGSRPGPGTPEER